MKKKKKKVKKEDDGEGVGDDAAADDGGLGTSNFDDVNQYAHDHLADLTDYRPGHEEEEEEEGCQGGR